MVAPLRAEKKTKASLRINEANPNHHIWDNNGTFFCDYTLHLPDNTKERIRRSLKTRDLEEARRRRDEIFRNLQAGNIDEPRATPCSTCAYRAAATFPVLPHDRRQGPAAPQLNGPVTEGRRAGGADQGHPSGHPFDRTGHPYDTAMTSGALAAMH